MANSTDIQTPPDLPPIPEDIPTGKWMTCTLFRPDDTIYVWLNMDPHAWPKGQTKIDEFAKDGTTAGPHLASFRDGLHVNDWDIEPLSTAQIDNINREAYGEWLSSAKKWFIVTADGQKVLGNDNEAIVGIHFEKEILRKLDASESELSYAGGLHCEVLLKVGRLVRKKPAYTNAQEVVLWEYYPKIGQSNNDSASSQSHSTPVEHEKDPVDDDVQEFLDLLDKETNVIAEGVAGSGKTHLEKGIRESHTYEHVEMVVFHPSTSYEDFVVGIRPVGELFVTKPGIFTELCVEAARNPNKKYLLFIDEINRANTAKVLGDLLMPLEQSKRTDFRGKTGEDAEALTKTRLSESETFIRLQTPLKKSDLPKRPETDSSSTGEDQGASSDDELWYLRVPANLYILGTMNTTDRSVGTIDLALRRRFTWKTMTPWDKGELSAEFPDPALANLIEWFDAANDYLKAEVGPDAMLGHSYFFGEDSAPNDIAQKLLKQLAEIAYTFRLKQKDLDDIFADYESAGVSIVGKGLGQRPVADDKWMPVKKETDSTDGNK